MALRIVATKPNPALVTLPWHLSLDEWGDDVVVPLPRGISRHIVRIVRLGQDVYAVKQTREQWANREYRLLRDLRRLGLPAVEPVGVVSGREAARRRGDRARAGHPAPAVLPALPVAVQPRPPARQPAEDPRRAGRAARAAAPGRVLLGRRVAVQRAVPAQRRRVRGVPRRRRDRRAARDAQPRPALARPRGGADQHLRRAARPAGRRAAQRGRSRPTTSSTGCRSGTTGCGRELTGTEEYTTDEIWRIEQRMERLNELGFDVDELDIVTDWDGVDGAGAAQGRRGQPPRPRAAAADRPRRRGQPGPPAAQRPGGLHRAPRPRRREPLDRRAPLADHGLRADHRDGAAVDARQARAGRGVPRDPRAPLVPVRAARPPGAHRRRRPVLHRHGAHAPAPRRSSPASPRPPSSKPSWTSPDGPESGRPGPRSPASTRASSSGRPGPESGRARASFTSSRGSASGRARGARRAIGYVDRARSHPRRTTITVQPWSASHRRRSRSASRCSSVRSCHSAPSYSTATRCRG